VPGGGLEPDETACVAALREVTEEAGVRGNIDRCLGVFEASLILNI
jgi:diphosphoinositol-polyphosphate diphosphatase